MANALGLSPLAFPTAACNSLRLLPTSLIPSHVQVGIYFTSFDGLWTFDHPHQRSKLLIAPGKSFKPLHCMVSSSAIPIRVSASANLSPAVPKQKIRIKLRSYWVPLIEVACKQILDAARSTNSSTMGPVSLPTKRRVYCVLRSPHVHKDSREHFETRTHHRLIDIEDLNASTIDALMQLDLPAGVDVEVKLST
eukprot:c13883_g1_i1 orf=316-897(-)